MRKTAVDKEHGAHQVINLSLDDASLPAQRASECLDVLVCEQLLYGTQGRSGSLHEQDLLKHIKLIVVVVPIAVLLDHRRHLRHGGEDHELAELANETGQTVGCLTRRNKALSLPSRMACDNRLQSD
nr:hypothetical protein [uncultured Adlercreutzia sp.]